jgi:MFS family permease
MYITSGLMWARFFIPVLALFYIASQVPIEQFAVIMGIFSLSILLLEIPTGVVADLLGKKKTIIIGRFFYLIEIAIIAFANGFWLFLIAKIISGIGLSLTSGTYSAMVYDSLKKMKREKEYKKISGKIQTITNISMAVVFVIGAYLFTIHYKLPAIVSLPLVGIGFALSFLFKEPYKSKKSLTIKNSVKHLKQGLRYFWNHRYIKYLVIYSFGLASALAIPLYMSSAYFELILIPISLIGVIAFISSMTTAYATKQAHKWEKTLGEKKSLRFIQIFTLAGILLISLMMPYFGALVFLLIPLMSGFFGILINDYINKHIESSHRATMLSITNFFASLSIFLFFPIVGYLTKYSSMGFSFLFLGIILFIFLILSQIYAKRARISQNL